MFYSDCMKISAEFVKYCLVGVVNTFCGLGSAYFCLNYLDTTYFVSAVIAYVIGILVSFSLNKKFTFGHEGKAGTAFFKFIFTMLPSYIFSYFSGWALAKIVLSAGILGNVFLKIFSLFSICASKFSDNLALFLSMLIYLILGYSINKYFVFKKNKSQ